MGQGSGRGAISVGKPDGAECRREWKRRRPRTGRHFHRWLGQRRCKKASVWPSLRQDAGDDISCTLGLSQHLSPASWLQRRPVRGADSQAQDPRPKRNRGRLSSSGQGTDTLHQRSAEARVRAAFLSAIVGQFLGHLQSTNQLRPSVSVGHWRGKPRHRARKK